MTHFDLAPTRQPRLQQYKRAVSVDRERLADLLKRSTAGVRAAQPDRNLHEDALAAAPAAERGRRARGLSHKFDNQLYGRGIKQTGAGTEK